VVEYYKEYYVPKRMVLSIVSDIPFNSVVSFLNKTELATLESNCREARRQNMGICNLTIAPKLEPTILTIRVTGVDTIYLNIAFRTCGRGNEDIYKLQLLANVLGATMTSRVYLLLREDNGLTYTSYVTNVVYSYSGYFTIFAITDSEKLMKNGSRPGVLPLCVNMLTDLVKKGISKKELDATKNYLREKAKMNIENEEKMCFYNGHRALVYGDDFADYSHHYDKMLNTSLSEINETIGKYFNKSNMFISMVGGGIPSDSKLEEIVERFDK
jgi:predicted Zn-dependent peptidase